MRKLGLYTLIYTFVLFFYTGIHGQSNIVLNGDAPEIYITDWIANVPADKELDNKFIVLEFWATWCGPCIAAVPHMNELQEEFKQNDLYFISITDESVAKVERSLKRIDFRSIVVSDQTKKTHIAYGDGVNGLEAYPLTVLIDKSGRVKWIGKPKELNASKMSAFLEGEAVVPDNFRDPASEVSEVKLETFDLIELLTNEEVSYYFNLKESEGKNKVKQTMGNALIKLQGHTLEDIYNDVLGVNSTRLDFPVEFIEKRFDLIYKNMENPDDISSLERELLLKLGLKKETKIETNKAYMVAIADASLLDEALEEGFSAQSDADDKTIFTGYTITHLLDELANMTNVTFIAEEAGEKKYDFIIENKSTYAILKSLQSYGLVVTMADVEVDLISLQVMP